MVHRVKGICHVDILGMGPETKIRREMKTQRKEGSGWYIKQTKINFDP
jgi:hypothetical protein